MIDFAQTFARTFPNGMHIEPEDVLPILRHFATIPDVAAPATPPAQTKPTRTGHEL